MGGDVVVRSEEGVGSTFFLWLPAASVASAMGTAMRDAAPDASSDAPPDAGPADHPPAAASADPAHDVPAAIEGGPLRAASAAILAELERVLHAYVARLRSDPATPSAHDTSEAQLEDHLASFLADLAGALVQLDDGANGSSPEATSAIRDSTAIQRVVSERHGAQRARLGWSAAEVRREFRILREELEAAVQRRVPAVHDGPAVPGRGSGIARALEVMSTFLDAAEQLSHGELRAGRGAARGTVATAARRSRHAGPRHDRRRPRACARRCPRIR